MPAYFAPAKEETVNLSPLLLLPEDFRRLFALPREQVKIAHSNVD